MNETRKAIIKLIEPFMDKVLSEGCIILQGLIYSKYICDKRENGYGTEIGRYKGYHLINFKLEKILDKYEIIGHYDITAVLKYIKYKKNYDISYSNGFIINTKMENGYYLTYSLPNKPLHLYSEQEEQDLLNLLLKLKNND